MQRIRRADTAHGDRCRRYADRERAWYALRDTTEKDTPPRIRFAYPRIDTLVAYIKAQRATGRVKPKLPGEKCSRQARLMEKGLNEWRRRDHWEEKEVELILKACIYGVAPAKSVWDYYRCEETQTQVVPSLMPGRSPRIKTSKMWVTNRAQPSLVPIDPFDF